MSWLIHVVYICRVYHIELVFLTPILLGKVFKSLYSLPQNLHQLNTCPLKYFNIFLKRKCFMLSMHFELHTPLILYSTLEQSCFRNDVCCLSGGLRRRCLNTDTYCSPYIRWKNVSSQPAKPPLRTRKKLLLWWNYTSFPFASERLISLAYKYQFYIIYLHLLSFILSPILTYTVGNVGRDSIARSPIWFIKAALKL